MRECTPEQQGFTLLELLIVTTLLGLAALLFTTRITDDSARTLRAELREITAVLNRAHHQSIISGHPVAVHVAEQSIRPLDELRVNRWRGEKGQLNWGNRKTAHPGGDGEWVETVIFYPTGDSSGGEFMVREGKYSARIKVNAITGKITSTIVVVD